MNPIQLAQQLNQTEYPLRLDSDTVQSAKENRLMVIWGESDDLVEIAGIVRDEAGAYDGTSFYVDANGCLPVDAAGDILNDKKPTHISQVLSLAKRYQEAVLIKVEWCPDDSDLSWRVTFPQLKGGMSSASFVIVRDGQPYCQGLIIQWPAPAE